ncbi:MAG TPA: hypothetical protein PLP19_19415 [bacterium]|nr:hypothetical protein [bacterium]HPN45666.1 hypothetical protein [bacterium]
MRRFYVLFVVVMWIVLLSCFDKHGMYVPDNDDSLRFLSFTDNQCQGELASLAKALTGHVYIMDHCKNGDTLTMRIHYSANCYPGFVNDATVGTDSIVIAIADTIRGALCMCEYENDYQFFYPYYGNVRVIFKWWDIHHEFTETYMDTTIQVGKARDN